MSDDDKKVAAIIFLILLTILLSFTVLLVKIRKDCEIIRNYIIITDQYRKKIVIYDPDEYYNIEPGIDHYIYKYNKETNCIDLIISYPLKEKE